MKESQAYQWIIDEGIVIAWRTAVLDVVEVRFGKREVRNFKETVEAIENPKQLRTLCRLAIRCKNLDELRCSIPG